jgi:hypothetical protein
MFAACFIAMLFTAYDGYVFRIGRLRCFALLFHGARIAALAAAIRHIAASFHVGCARRVLVFHRARTVFAAAAHFSVMRIIRSIVGKNHHRKSENKQNGNCQNYSFFHFNYLKI